MKKSLVNIIIPHYNGVSFIDECLKSVFKTVYKPIEVIVIDNGSTDGSQAFIKKKYPQVKLIQSSKNLGYAGGCTYGFEKSTGEFIVFLNNDTTVDKQWLTYLVKAAKNKDVALCQPKVLSIRQPAHFEYAGAAGGYMDRWGYTFCRGRLFDVCEQDKGQYDQEVEIFWASGVCLFVKRSVLQEIGAFDPYFFMYYEEEDLCWRAHLKNYKVFFVPKAKMYHYGEKTAKNYPFRKYYYFHRNHTILLIKNYSWFSLARVLPKKFMLDGIMAAYFLMIGQWKRSFCIIAALASLPFNLRKILYMREKTQKLRKRDEQEIWNMLYPKNIALSFFLRGRKTFTELLEESPSFRKQLPYR